jgi:Tfp pilus assembly protein PilO
MSFLEPLKRMTHGRALLIGLVLAAFYYFFFMDDGLSKRSVIQQNQSRLAELEKSIKDSQAKLDRAAVYKATVAEVGGTIDKIVALIPDKFATSDLMRIVSNEVNALTPKNPEPWSRSPEFEEFSLRVEMTGSFAQHMIFLANLTKTKQVLIVNRYELSHVKDGKGDEPALVKMAAEIVAYRHKGSAPKPAAGGA